MTDKFTGGDPEYLRTSQYGTTDRLQARANLHVRYSTAEMAWFPWMVAQIPWGDGPVVEVGCGTGAMWEEGRPPVDGSIVLTDLSEGMVAAATARASAAGYEAAGLVVPAQDLSLGDAACSHAISNHMLYHVPQPRDAVAQLARVVADDGLVTVATNGENHMRELKELEHVVFSSRVIDRAIAAFGLVTGAAILESVFEEVELRRYPDSLLVTDPTDAMAYLMSFPPGEDATHDQLASLESAVDEAFAVGDGTLEISKDVGLFLCRGPRR